MHNDVREPLALIKHGLRLHDCQAIVRLWGSLEKGSKACDPYTVPWGQGLLRTGLLEGHFRVLD